MDAREVSGLITNTETLQNALTRLRKNPQNRLLPDPFVEVCEYDFFTQQTRIVAGVFACLSVAGGCLVIVSGLVSYGLVDRLGRNLLIRRFDDPAHEESAAWTALSIGFGLVAIDELASSIFVLVTSQSCWDIGSIKYGWPERRWVYMPRYAVSVVGSTLIFAFALRIVSLLDDNNETFTLFPFAGYVQWMTHDTAVASDVRAALEYMLVGVCFRIATLVIQFAAFDGFNVCYILPVPRDCSCCGSLEDKPAASEHASVRDLYEQVWFVRESDNWAARYVHNWWGALRMHVHLSDLLLFSGLYLRYQLYTLERPPSFGPRAYLNDMIHVHSNTIYSANGGFVVGDGDHNDTSTLMASAVLVIVAGVLAITSAIAKAAGISRFEASLPTNHYHLVRYCWQPCP